MLEIKLSGSLRRFGRSFRVDARSAREACTALATMIPGFRQHLLDSERRGVRFAVFVDRRNVGEQQLDVRGQREVRLVPVLAGSAKAGLLQTILGVILIVAGVLLSETPFGAPLIGAGISLTLGGIIQLLVPVPKDKQKAGSTFFDGPVNTVIQGGCVPYLYGEGIVGSVRISAGIDILATAVNGDPETTDPVISYD